MVLLDELIKFKSKSLGALRRIIGARGGHSPGGSAFLYESIRDYNQQAFRTALQNNLQREGLLRRLIAPHFLRKQLSMTYSTDEIQSIVAQTSFAAHASITPISLGGLPIWLKIVLQRA